MPMTACPNSTQDRDAAVASDRARLWVGWGGCVRGSHRARSTIASQLYNAKEPMTLFELQAWLGHRSPQSTTFYAKITPTTLNKAYDDAGYFACNVRTIEVLLDRDAVTSGQAAAGEPWQYYDLGAPGPGRSAAAVGQDRWMTEPQGCHRSLDGVQGVETQVAQQPLTADPIEELGGEILGPAA
jgi:hypothetical protein